MGFLTQVLQDLLFGLKRKVSWKVTPQEIRTLMVSIQVLSCIIVAFPSPMPATSIWGSHISFLLYSEYDLQRFPCTYPLLSSPADWNI